MPRRQPVLGTIRQTPNGMFDADARLHNIRKRKRCKTRKEAEAFLEVATIDLLNNRRTLTHDEARDALEAIELSEGRVSLKEAVTYYLKNAAPVTVKPMREAIEEYLETKSALRPKTRVDVKARVGVLPQNVTVDKITTSTLSSILNEREIGIVSRNNYRRNWGCFFTWAIKMGYCQTNPAESLQRAPVDDEPPVILTTQQTRELLTAANTEGVAAYFVIGLFAGVRREELDRLDWSSIGPEYIDLSGAVTKKRRRRVVTICPTLRVWLDQFASTGILKIGRRTWRRVIGSLSFVWPRNAMRHSFASYHLALYKNSALTSHELGHTSPDILFRHYRELVTQSAAEEYFNLSPDAVLNHTR